MRRPIALAGGLLLGAHFCVQFPQLAPVPTAEASITVTLVPSFDGTRNTKYPAGDKPQGGGDTCVSGWTCVALGEAECQFADVSGDQRITARTGDGYCAALKHSATETNRQFLVRLLNDVGWNGQQFAGGGIIFTEDDAEFTTDYRSIVWWPQATRVRCRFDETGTTTVHIGAAGTALDQYLGFQRNASTNTQYCWESENGSTMLPIAGGAGVVDLGFSNYYYGVFAKSGDEATSVTMTFSFEADGTTLNWGGTSPDPGNETEAIIARISKQAGGPDWSDGPGQPTSGYPDVTNKWTAWLGYAPGITAVWDSCAGQSGGTTWADFEAGNGCGYFRDATAGDSGIPDTTTLVIARPLWPQQFANLKNCPANRAAIWQSAANGALDQHYQNWLSNLLVYLNSVGRDPDSLVIRLAWEMTGQWYPWSVCDQHEYFRQTWNRVVAIIRDRLPGVLIDFAPAQRYPSLNNPRCDLECLGGPLDFDIVSLSVHDGNPMTTNEATFNEAHRNNPNDAEIDLDELRDFAIGKDRPFGFSEYSASVGTVDQCEVNWPPTPHPELFVEYFYDFLVEPESQGRVAYAIWLSSGCYNLYNRTNHIAAQKYKQLWLQ